MHNQQPMAGTQNQLEEIVREQQNHLTALKQMLREQQAELAGLREILAHKSAAPVVSAILPEPGRTPKTDTSRRKMLKRMGLAVLAGGAALGIASATYAPAEAKLSVNPSSNVGAVVIRNGATITGIPSTNFGLIAIPDSSLNVGTFDFLGNLTNVGIGGFTTVDANSVGVLGVSNNGVGVFGRSTGGARGVIGRSDGDNANGVYGVCSSGTGIGVYGNSTNGNGVKGTSNTTTGIGVYGFNGVGVGVVGETGSSASPAINAKSGASSGIAWQIERGGITVKEAGVGTSTAAFIHKTIAGNFTTNYTWIDNPLCNGRPNALLFVTYNKSGSGSIGPYIPHVYAVFYDNGDSAKRWNISFEDSFAMSANLYFNVLIINP